ncbi:radical SAM protein [Tenacibaculum sp. FZY0031]|uniref:radical SAM/SPASM domain-containing protein n=1 Tax=Tenacibaculum sp. FZY0031 TaxID=3116648 RepID=UPI002EBD9494|nr:radical SAM protein [Tenacibaculum sp. FZY0031]
MKYSQFNSIISIDNVFYLYNSFIQKFIVIDPLLKDLLESAVIEGIDGLEEIHPDFFSYLKSEGFLIPKETDEVGKIKEIVKNVDENVDSFFLTINPTMNCNFKCWYCYETHIKKSSFSDKMINKVSRFIEKTTQKPKMNYLSLAFFGGEPLLYFKRDVTPVIKKLQKECRENLVDYSISFTTNGYLIDDYFINFFKSHEITPSLQITLDGYGKKHDEVRYVTKTKGSYVEIVNNIKLLLNNGFPVRLRINYTKDNIDDAYKIADEFDDIDLKTKKEFLLIDLHRVWQDSGNEDIPNIVNKNIQYIKSKKIPVKHNSPNNVVESCYADKRNSVVINYNGDIYKCTARDFTKENRAGYLTDEGDLTWENDYLERRMDVKFKNNPCLTCRLLPICNGGCSQHAMEALEEGGRGEYCIYDGDDKLKDDVVKSKIEEIIGSLELNEA